MAVAVVAAALVVALLVPATPAAGAGQTATPTTDGTSVAHHAASLARPVTSTARLSTTTPVVTQGDRLVLRGRVTPRVRRVVQLQRRSSNGWYVVQRGSTDRRGHVAFRSTASATGPARFRALVPRARLDGRWYREVRSNLLQVRVQPAGRWRSIETQSGVTCGIALDDSGWCWGDNGQGQVGNSSTTPIRWLPARVPGAWSQLHSSGWTTCGIRTDATGWCWGRNDRGEVGDGSTIDRLGPQLLSGRWRHLNSNAAVTCGVRTDNSAWCWGDNRFGSLGDAGSLDQSRPVRVLGSWRTVETSGGHTCGIRSDDTGWCWGPVYGADGVDRTPRGLPGRWRSFSLHNRTICGVQTDGSGWCWGNNHNGMLGVGDTLDRTSPTRVPGTWSRIDITPHGTNTCGIRTDSSGWCWGSGSGGTIGDGATVNRFAPRQVPGTWRSILTDNGTTCGVRTDDTGWCWGINDSGEIGNGTSGVHARSSSPQLLAGRWSSVLTGYVGTTCGVRTDHTGWCWGNGLRGELGDGSTSRLRPHLVP